MLLPVSVCGDDRGFESVGKLYVKGIYEAQVVATAPGTGEQRLEEVALDRGSGHPMDPRSDLSDCQMSCAVQAPQGGKHFRVEVSRDMKLMTS